jgi:multiple sugar transport system ATP-binding protein
VATFIGTPPMNLWAGTIVRRAGHLVFVSGSAGPAGPELPVPLDEAEASRFGNYVGREILLGLRPEHIDVIPIPAGELATLVGTVEHARYTGAETIYEVALAGRKWVVRLAAGVTLEIGQRIALRCAWSHARVFDPVTGVALGS